VPSTELPVGIRSDICANGETWEFSLTLDGHRVGRSIFRSIPHPGRPTLDEQFNALRDLLHKTDAEHYTRLTH
jgi:hypothetical protein